MGLSGSSEGVLPLQRTGVEMPDATSSTFVEKLWATIPTTHDLSSDDCWRAAGTDLSLNTTLVSSLTLSEVVMSSRTILPQTLPQPNTLNWGCTMSEMFFRGRR